MAGAGISPPSQLKLPSYIDSGVFRAGEQYRYSWPWQQVYRGPAQSAVFTPDYAVEGDADGLAYATYLFYTAGNDYGNALRCDWAIAADYADCWIGMADFVRDCWQWHPVSPANVIYFDEAASIDGGNAIAIVVLTGNDAWQLSSIYLGSDKPPFVTGVQPTAGVAGAQVTVEAQLSTSPDEVDTWHWDFGAGAVPGTSDAPAPVVTLAAPGVYACEVRAANALGESIYGFLLSVNPETADWHVEGVATAGDIVQTSLALEPAGAELPHIAFVDQQTNTLQHAFSDGATWYLETPQTGVEATAITNTSLATDGAGNPCLSYCYGDYLMYATRQSQTWKYLVADTEEYPGGAGGMWETFMSPALALEAANYPHVSYRIREIADDWWREAIAYATFDGEHWGHLEITFAGGLMFGGYAGCNRIAVGNDNSIWLPYYTDPDDEGGDYGIKEFGCSRKPPAAAWQQTPAVDEASPCAVSIDISPNDMLPRICYSLGGELYYGAYDGNEWHTYSIGGTGTVGSDISLKLTSTGSPRICYYDQSAADLCYAYLDGLLWKVKTVDSPGAVGRHCSLALSSSDRPHFSYYDSSNDCLKYARVHVGVGME